MGCPWWGLLVLVTSYVAVWHARGAPPPLREGVSWFVPFNSLALAGWTFCLKKKKKEKELAIEEQFLLSSTQALRGIPTADGTTRM